MTYNYTYNMSFEEGVNNTADFFSGINNASGGLPAIGLLTLIWLAVFFISRLSGADVGESWTVTSFVSSVVGGFLLFLEWISWQTLLIPLIMLIFGIIYLSFK